MAYAAASLIDVSTDADPRGQAPPQQQEPEDDEPPPTLCERYAAGKMVVDPREHAILPFWDAALLFLIIIVALRCPYQIGFLFVEEMRPLRKESLGKQFDKCVDLIFALDTFFQFFISATDPVNHRWIRMPNVIVKQYWKTHFFYDFLSVFPYDATARYCRLHLGERFKYLGVFKIMSLLKLMRVDRLISRYESRLGLPNAITKLVKLLCMLVFSLHWIACCWGGVLSLQTILNLHHGYTWGDGLRAGKPAMFADDNYEAPFELYTASLYWSCMTLTSIGYGDITASNTLECWAAILMMGACGIIWANIIGSICAIVGSLDADNVAYENQMDSLNVMMANFHLPDDNRMQIREYFQRRKVMNNHQRQVELLHCMSPDLQGAVARHVQEELLEKVWIFKRLMNCEHVDSLAVGLFERFEFTMYPPKELVVLPGCFVCVRSGVGLLMSEVLKVGSFWGVADILLSNPKLWENSKVLSLSYVELQYLMRDAFLALLMEYPEEYKGIRRRAAWLAVKIAVIRGVVVPLSDEELEVHTEEYLQMRARDPRPSTQSSTKALENLPRMISKDSSAPAPQKNAEKQDSDKRSFQAEKAEAKLSAALDIMRSGKVTLGTGRRAEQSIDALLKTLSQNDDMETKRERFNL